MIYIYIYLYIYISIYIYCFDSCDCWSDVLLLLVVYSCLLVVPHLDSLEVLSCLPIVLTIQSIPYPLDFSGILAPGFEYIVHGLNVRNILISFG